MVQIGKLLTKLWYQQVGNQKWSQTGWRIWVNSAISSCVKPSVWRRWSTSFKNSEKLKLPDLNKVKAGAALCVCKWDKAVVNTYVGTHRNQRRYLLANLTTQWVIKWYASLYVCKLDKKCG